MLPRERLKGVEEAVYRSTLASRVDAGATGKAVARDELSVVARGAYPLDLFGMRAAAERFVAKTVDLRRADLAAKSYGKALRAEQAGAASLKESVEALQYRLDRIAATESSQAFNAAKIEEVEVRAEASGILLFKSWNAELDACPYCKDLEDANQEVPIGESYSGGAEPGSVHPNCRCSEDISA